MATYDIDVVVTDPIIQDVHVTVFDMSTKGVPPGGIALQVLTKVNSVDNNVTWAFVTGVPDGGTTGQTIQKTSNLDGEITWSDHVLQGDPASPPPGLGVGQLLWDGNEATATAPRGVVALATGGVTDLELAAGEIIPGLTTTSAVNFKAGRKYRITASWVSSNRSAETGPHFQTLGIRLDSTEIMAKTWTVNAPGSWLYGVVLDWVYSPTSDGSFVVNVYSQTASYYVGSFNRKGILIVEDIGGL